MKEKMFRKFSILIIFVIQNVMAKECVNQEVYLNTNAEKSRNNVHRRCDRSDFFNFDASKHVVFYYTKDGKNYSKSPPTHCDKGEKVLLGIHGFCDEVDLKEKYWMYALMKVLLSTDEYKYGVIISYTDLCCNFLLVRGRIGRSIGDYLSNHITGTLGLRPSSVDAFAHSLGNRFLSYMADDLRRNNKGQLNKIFALCIGSPILDLGLTGLHGDDARTVVNFISDNYNLIGSNQPRGDVNFYTNPHDRIQPGCTSSDCNHEMCINFFLASSLQSIRNDKDKFIYGKCNPNRNCPAADSSHKKAGPYASGRGCFCAETSACFPYWPKPTSS
ncbi:uncharacterized protein LOC116349334 [Contarinia nasturtii]|uniref:uncharacterized protein LOC116349334 n=1 Tax=Contarinia nasturtii TaxID=265458 RepID=UPI0012D407D5|nr:uncharacterized protein LOC116349334 [Contarinia nasturtii]